MKMDKLSTHSAANFSSDRLIAIRMVKEIANLILGKRQKLRATILALREGKNTMKNIGELVIEDLRELGALTSDVRRAVVGLICRASLSPDGEREIKRDIRQDLCRKKNNLTDEGRKNAWKATQNYPWTPDIDAKLLELSTSILHTKQPYTGTPNWQGIAREMMRLYEINFTGSQWRCRARAINTREDKRRKRREAKASI